VNKYLAQMGDASIATRDFGEAARYLACRWFVTMDTKSIAARNA